MNLSPKIISVLSLLQFFFVLAGYLFTQSCLKFYDRAVTGGFQVERPELPLFVRAYGLWFLFVPFVWASIAALRGRAVRGIAYISPLQFIFGSVLTAAIATIFLLSAYRALMVLS